jgi:undecaprenyl-diphosphatase
MDYLRIIILAVVEGVTEFLPISSTGHLVLVEEYVQLAQNAEFCRAFTVIIQLPAILAVVVYFWRTLCPWGKPLEERQATIALWTKIAVAFLPAAVLGLLLDDFISAHLQKPVPVACALLVGGVILIFMERRKKDPTVPHAGNLGYARALGIGFFQCLAMFPGTSRSGATIIGGMALGASRAAAAEFSFFLAIPTMAGACAVRLFKNGAAFSAEQWGLLAVGSLVSFAVAYGVIAFLMNYIRKHDFQAFGYYRIVLGVVVLAYYWLVGFGT